MQELDDGSRPTRTFWIIGGVALAWNLMGVMTYWMSVTMSPEALNAMPDPERALYKDVPAWVTASYAIAVFGGTMACLMLLMRKAWAPTVFAVSLIAIVLQMGHALFMTAMVEVRGASSIVLPLLVVVVAAYLVWFSRSAAKKGWLG